MNTSFDVSQFGISDKDEYTHPFSPDHPDWNESYFFDWYNEDATFAGHCRIGWHPVQRRVLFWLYLHHDGEWFMIEECRLPLSDLQLDYNAETPEQAVQGRISLTCANGDVITADVAALTGTEIDITHTFSTPRRTEYRRSLVSCRFLGRHEGVASPGWFECNRSVTSGAQGV